MTQSQIETLCDNLASSEPAVRYGSAKKLSDISEQTPQLLYSRFDFFARFLDGDNRILRWNATRILGYLAPVDRAQKIEKVLDRLLSPIPGPDLITAANAIQAAAPIVLAKPHLADRIAGEILKVRRATYATPDCRDIAIGHAIQSLKRFYPHIQKKAPVLAFVRAQMENPRPATRRKAEKFLLYAGGAKQSPHSVKAPPAS